jgi:transcriptional regulator with XRE-family HTH domain
MDHEQEHAGGVPAVAVTADQVVALNLRHWRREAGLTQEAAGKLLGWSADNVSSAERSWDGSRDRRRFDAQALAEIALALGVPLAALFLPPPGDGTEARYLLAAGGRSHAMGEVMALLVMPDNDDDTPVMDAYRARFNEAAARYLDPQWAAAAARRAGAGLSAQARDDIAARLADQRDGLLRAAQLLGELSGAIREGDQP